jgi:cysteinyl-tRNA synthetase
MIAAYRADTDRLGLGRPDAEPLATGTMDSIVALIEDLVAGGHAYEAGGDVYFRVRSLPSYGELSHRSIEDMDQGEGVEGADRKQDPLDFALWKARKPAEDAAWPSPWGEGRPGWHIECSAMAEDVLGVDFDIHGGGIDLVFPHHENEAAQTLAARGKPLARIWMHNGMLGLAGDEKMSKSVGNIRGLAEVLDEVGRDTLIMFFCGGHYRQPLVYRPDVLDDAAARVARVREAGRRLVPGASPEDMAPLRDAFFDALGDDFNTPQALASLFEWVREPIAAAPAWETPTCARCSACWPSKGLLDADEGPPADVVASRRRGRPRAPRRTGSEADRLRDALRDRGWTVRDGAGGPELVPAE